MNDPVPIPPGADKQRMSFPLFLAYILLFALLLTITICALSALLIRGLDDVFLPYARYLNIEAESARALAAHFSSLDQAELSVHHEIPALLSFIFTLGIGSFLRLSRRMSPGSFVFFVVCAVIIGLALFLVSLFLSVWMTDVNDMSFRDFVLSAAKSL